MPRSTSLGFVGFVGFVVLAGGCAAGGIRPGGDAAVGPDARTDAGVPVDARADAQVDAATPPHCLDGVTSGDESDTDCGGLDCPRCDLGDDCHGATDCASGVCTLDVCACAAGYEPDAQDGCVDTNECALNTDDCDPMALCTNTEGGFECECPLGYSGDGTVCTDVDECAAGTDDCAANATCENLPGSFACHCATGYSGDGHTCTDVNECTAGTAGCSPNATCANTDGSYTCTCNPGYSGDGFTCNGTTCGSLGDPQAAALAACQAQFPNCQSSGYLGIVGWNEPPSCYTCNCDAVTDWQFFCFGTGTDDWDCGPCELGRIRSAHTVSCNCDAGTTTYLGWWCNP